MDLRKQIERNYFLNDFLRKTLLFRQNATVTKHVTEFSKIDSISDFPLFKAAVKHLPIPSKGYLFSVKRAFGESLLYGHLHAVQRYAGFSDKELSRFPIMEHGVNFWEDCNKAPFSRVCQGNYLSKRWFAQNPGSPLFTIGPYIYYASAYYDPEAFQACKNRYGKILLVVPAHTHEMATQAYNMKKFVSDIMEAYQKDYDTVMVLAYWADLSYDLYDLFEAAGAKIVSAGFRGDPNFISRLKTILSLADKIVGNDLGTFLGYGVYLKKPVGLIKNDISYELLDVDLTTEEETIYQNTLKEFYRLFGEGQTPDPAKQEALCERFWGFHLTKSPDEIRAILNINRSILKMARGNAEKIKDAADRFLNSPAITELERGLLSDALGLK